MMAGLGKKTWATDDILTAVDLNGYVAEQVVMVFANSAARTSGITFPSEGMVTYLSDTDRIDFYNGTSWLKVNAGTADYATTAGTAATAGTAVSANTVLGRTIFIQAGTPTATGTNDLWFW